jgi:hypothetical protein
MGTSQNSQLTAATDHGHHTHRRTSVLKPAESMGIVELFDKVVL